MKLDFAKMPALQQENLRQALKAYQAGEVVSSARPSVLYLELTQNCFSRCAFCKRWWKNKPEYVMSKELFDLLIRDYIPYAALVDLRGWGESLTLPDFPDYVRRVAEGGSKIRLTTTLGCGSREALQSLIDYDVFVSVSFDGAEKSTYEKIRRGIKYDTVLKNLDFLIDKFREKGRLKDNLRLAVMPLQSANLKLLEGVVRFAAKKGISEVVTDALSARAYHPGLLRYHRRNTLLALQAASSAALETGVKFRLCSAPFPELSLKSRAFDRCAHPWFYLFVNYRGNAIACDHLMRPSCERFAFGNIASPIEEVWNGPSAQKMRRAHLKKEKSLLPWMCKNECYGLGRYADHEHEIEGSFARWTFDQDDIISCTAKHLKRAKL